MVIIALVINIYFFLNLFKFFKFICRSRFYEMFFQNLNFNQDLLKKLIIIMSFLISLVIFIQRPVVLAENTISTNQKEYFKDCPNCPEMIKINIPTENNKIKNFKSFALSKYEITWDNWLVCVNNKDCKQIPNDHGWGKGDLPIMNITWLDANDYVKYLTNITGKIYRLPTELEWEYAASAGTKTKFWWGDSVGEGNANCRKCGTKWDGKSSSPVGSFAPNPFGLYDMNGNVWEWNLDCWSSSKNNDFLSINTELNKTCDRRVIKSGSWYYIPKLMTPSYRDSYPASLFSYNIGIRVLREIN